MFYHEDIGGNLMFEYGNLKYVKVADEEFSWFFVTEKDGNFTEVNLGNIDMLQVLNYLGKDKWELVAIDATTGFVLKRNL